MEDCYGGSMEKYRRRKKNGIDILLVDHYGNVNT